MTARRVSFPREKTADVFVKQEPAMGAVEQPEGSERLRLLLT